MGGKLVVVLVALFATLAVSGSAQGTKPGPGATLTVGKQSASCPSPDYLRIRDAIDHAKAGDTIAICPGTYAEGPGMPGTSGLMIDKNLTIRGAGADQVTIEPTSVNAKRIAPDEQNLRSGKGAIIAVLGD